MDKKFYVIEIRDGIYVKKSDVSGRGEKSVMLTDSINNAERYGEDTEKYALNVAKLSYGRLRVLTIKYELGDFIQC